MTMIFNNKKPRKLEYSFSSRLFSFSEGGGLFTSGRRTPAKREEARGANLGIIEVCYQTDNNTH